MRNCKSNRFNDDPDTMDSIEVLKTVAAFSLLVCCSIIFALWVTTEPTKTPSITTEQIIKMTPDEMARQVYYINMDMEARTK